MRKKFLLVGILLLVGGGMSVYGACFMFNRYSRADAYHFGGPAQSWRFPDPPIQLSEGDVLRVGTVLQGDGAVRMYIVNGAGTQMQLQQTGGVYEVETSGPYHVYVIAEWVGRPYGLDMGLSVGVTQKAPDPFFLVVGVLGVLIGAVSVSAGFVCKGEQIQEI